MKTLLVAINAKFTHSNLAVRYLQKYCEKLNISISFEEYTINQHVDLVLSEIMKKNADVIGFSCYIWNIEYIMKLVKAIKSINKDVFIILGGPEVSYDSEKRLSDSKGIDAIIFGEGEESFRETIMALSSSFDTDTNKVLNRDKALNFSKVLEGINGLVYRTDKGVIRNMPRKPISMDLLPFVYNHDELKTLENRIIYYETMRGCPFNCQYCLSSIEKGIRKRSISKVKNELQFFLDKQVMQVKLVDRTFNCDKEHAMEIWRYISKHDNKITNFHFEISADILDEDIINFLNTVRPGLFQFEIGVQSTYEKTLKEIHRKTDFNKLKANINRLKSGGNIHLHLDLIAGLPYEGYEEFEKSFNNVYNLYPHQLQLGFLKVLKGSGIYENCELYGIRYRNYAPYEVLQTNNLSYQQLDRLKMIEEMVELFYNSGQYEWTVRYVERFFESPFKLYESLALFWEDNGYHKISHSKIGLTTILRSFCINITGIIPEFLNEVLKFDLYLKEKLKKSPEWMPNSEGLYKNEINNFYKDNNNISRYLPQLREYSSKQISRIAHVEVFEYNMTNYIKTNGNEIDKKNVAILFNYENRDQMRHNALVNEVKI